MLFRVVRPMKRPESSSIYFRQRIPLDVVNEARGKTVTIPLGDTSITKSITSKANEIKLSLQTSDPSIAKTRQATAAAFLESYWQSLRQGPVTLSFKQCVALSGEIYTSFIDSLEEDPLSPSLWQHVKELDEAAIKGEFGIAQLMIPGKAKHLRSLEDRFGGFADAVLGKRGLIIDQESRERLLSQTGKAMVQAAEKLQKFADGDYSDDGAEKRFPKWEDKAKKPSATKAETPKVSIKGLLAGWWKESEATGCTASTKDSYTRTITYFCEFLKHDDASKVTPDDVVAYKDYRLHTPNPRTGKVASARTVKDSDLSALKAIFNWAVNNKKIPSNPAKDITVKVRKKVRTRPNYFKQEERQAILTKSKNYTAKEREGQKLALAKRWVPWICAYTGARVGEIAQLRKQDIRTEEGHWIFLISPDAGNIKGKAYREVPIHADLIEQGFLEFAEQSGDGFLFLDVKPGKSPEGKRKTLTNDLAEFIREVVPDPEIAPNHGWRHTFKTLTREVEGLNAKVVDDIVGHSSRSVGDTYGGSTIKAKSIVIKRFPWLTE